MDREKPLRTIKKRASEKKKKRIHGWTIYDRENHLQARELWVSSRADTSIALIPACECFRRITKRIIDNTFSQRFFSYFFCGIQSHTQSNNILEWTEKLCTKPKHLPFFSNIISVFAPQSERDQKKKKKREETKINERILRKQNQDDCFPFTSRSNVACVPALNVYHFQFSYFSRFDFVRPSRLRDCVRSGRFYKKKKTWIGLLGSFLTKCDRRSCMSMNKQHFGVHIAVRPGPAHQTFVITFQQACDFWQFKEFYFGIRRKIKSEKKPVRVHSTDCRRIHIFLPSGKCRSIFWYWFDSE